MMTPRIATVILHYGDPALARQLDTQLKAADPAEAEHIFVLDNHAHDRYLGAWHRTEENLYWAGALLFTLEAMEKKGYTHVWFLNNDVLFLTPAPIVGRVKARLTRLQKSIGQVGVYAPAVTGNPYHPQMIQNEQAQYRKVMFADGIAPLLNIECMHAIGGVDIGENVYGYGVETWLSLCAHNAGWPVIVDHQVLVRHTYHSTAKRVDGFLQRAAQAEHIYFTQRLGQNYKTLLDEYKHLFSDEDRL